MNRGRQTGRAPISRAWMRSHAAVRPGAPYPRTGASNCMTSIADANMPSPYRTGVARATSMSLGSRPRSRSQPITYSTAVATTSSGAVPEPPTTSSTSVKAPARTKKGMACRRRSAGICRSSSGGTTTTMTPSAFAALRNWSCPSKPAARWDVTKAQTEARSSQPARGEDEAERRQERGGTDRGGVGRLSERGVVSHDRTTVADRDRPWAWPGTSLITRVSLTGVCAPAIAESDQPARSCRGT